MERNTLFHFRYQNPEYLYMANVGFIFKMTVKKKKTINRIIIMQLHSDTINLEDHVVLTTVERFPCMAYATALCFGVQLGKVTFGQQDTRVHSVNCRKACQKFTFFVYVSSD